jgi:general secretion pathway protein K
MTTPNPSPDDSPATIAGPTVAKAAAPRPHWWRLVGRDRGRHVTERGMALILVAFITGFLGIVTAEFAYNTDVDYGAAANARDDMRAHYLARSGMNLSRLVIKVQKDIFDKYRKYLGDVQLADYLPMLTGIFGGSKEEVEGFAELIGGIDADNIKGLGLAEGEFDIAVTTDDGKINMNCAKDTSGAKQLELMLTALVSAPTLDKLFEERDGDGQFTDRQTFVRALIDWVDRDTAGYGNPGQPEDYGYESAASPYKARDENLDSLDELRLVRGMDARRWALFGGAFTIYGGCKVNVAAATDLFVLMALIYQTAKDPNDPVLRDFNKLAMLAARVAQARSLGVMWADLGEFANFVKDPDAALGDLLGGQAGQGGQGSSTPPPGQGPGEPLQGVELDRGKLNQAARLGGRRTYRVTATAKMGKVEKRIVGVWDTDFVNQNMRDPAYNKGFWVYWREE